MIGLIFSIEPISKFKTGKDSRVNKMEYCSTMWRGGIYTLGGGEIWKSRLQRGGDRVVYFISRSR